MVQEINSRCDTSNPSLQGLNGKGDANSDDKGFSEQRQTAIAKVKESMGDATGKSFVSRNKADSGSQYNVIGLILNFNFAKSCVVL